MTLEVCYQKLGGDYKEVLARLVKEERIEKYVLKFLDDMTFEELCAARKEMNHEEVFRMIHTLKGVSQNLGFGRLFLASNKMTEAVRGGIKLEDESLFEAVENAYLDTVKAIMAYKDELDS